MAEFEIPPFRLIAEHAVDVLAWSDSDRIVRWVSPSVTQILGWLPEDIVGQPSDSFIHEEDRVATETPTPGMTRSRELRVARKDGSHCWIRTTVAAVFDEQGHYLGSVSNSVDVDAEIRLRENLTRDAMHYQGLAENAADIVWLVNRDGNFVWISQSVQSILGWNPDDLVGTPSLHLVEAADRAHAVESRKRALSGEAVGEWEARYRTAHGSFRWFSVQARPYRDAAGEIVGATVALRDVHDLVAARQQLEQSERLFRLAMEGAPLGVAVIGLHNVTLRANQALGRLVGRSNEWLLENSFVEIIDPADREREAANRDRLLEPNAPSHTDTWDCRVLHADGSSIWTRMSCGLLRDEYGMPLFFVTQFLDISEAHARQNRLEFAAHHDALTNVGNRHMLVASIEAVGGRTKRTGTGVGALYLDIDNFKAINDTYGHVVGDEVLRLTAQRLAATVRMDDVVTRIGGDEFFVLLDGVGTLENAAAVAEKVRAALAVPLALPDHATSVSVTVSIGVAVAASQPDATVFMADADSALMRAKRKGRNCVSV